MGVYYQGTAGYPIPLEGRDWEGNGMPPPRIPITRGCKKMKQAATDVRISRLDYYRERAARKADLFTGIHRQ